jgi:phenylacetate-CoA ligase
MRQFATALLRYRPAVLQAYSNTLGLFARFVEDEGIVGIRPRGIVCSAEVLTDENRALIERVFRCRVFNRYGCREFAVIGSECNQHNGLHVNDENLLVEVLVGGIPREDEEGEIVVTDLRNLAMPMIRYRIGDMGVMTRTRCSCGRGLRLMKLVGGRTTDFLTSTAGRKVSGIVIATYVITNLGGIRQIQFVQEEPRRVVARLVKGLDFGSATIPELVRRVREYLGGDMQVDVEYVDSVPLTPSGKYRFSISKL